MDGLRRGEPTSPPPPWTGYAVASDLWLMSRYALTQSQKPQPTIEGDQSFTALNMKTDRAALPPGYYANAVNKRCENGVPKKRAGTAKPVFANVVPFGAIGGAGVYSNPNKTEVLMVADCVADTLWQIRGGNYPQSIPIQEGESLAEAEEVEILQINDKAMLLRSQTSDLRPLTSDLRPLIWDGISSAGFIVAKKSDPANTEVETIPNITTAEAFEDVILFPLPDDPNSFGMSDSLDYTTWDKILSKFTPSISGGAIVRLFEWNSGVLVIFKTGEVRTGTNFKEFALGVDGVTVGHWNARWQKVSDKHGLAGRRAVLGRATGLDFLSNPGGIYQVLPLAQNSDQIAAVDPIPVSDPIEPLIKRINWPAADKAVANMIGKHGVWAVPLDGSETNNALLVYDTTRQTQMRAGDTTYTIPVAWEGVDIFAGPISIDDLVVTNYLGQRRMFAIDKVAKAIYVLGVGREDELASGTAEIADVFEPRGYATLGWNATSKRDFKHIEVEVETWRPSVTVTLIGEGVNNERLLTNPPVTKDRRKYRQFGMHDFDVSNANNDFAVAGREDYSVEVPGPGSTGFYLHAGVDAEKKQASTIAFATRARGRWGSLRIESSQGECDVKSVLFDSTGVQRVPRRAA